MTNSPTESLVARLREEAAWSAADADLSGLMTEAAERLSTLEAALRPFAGERLPSTKRTRIDYDRHGLRRIISPMELAVKAAVLALSNEAGK